MNQISQPSENQSLDSRARLTPWAAAVVLSLFVLYFFMLGAYPLLDVDEPVYGQVAMEMVRGGDWLTPHYQGKPWFDKPPLFYWLTSACTVALGPNELACRLPSAILAVGIVLLVYLLALRDFGRRAGVFSAIVMATCLQQIVLARAAVTDMTFVFCLTCVLYAYRRWLDASGRALMGWGILCGAMTGLAMLAKGPVAPVLLGATFVIHLVWTGRAARLRRPDALAAVAAWLVVGMPWYIAMYALHGQLFVKGFLVANNVTRFLKAEHVAQTGGWYSYFLNAPILAGMFFPWSPFLPQAVARTWRTNDGARLAFVWSAVVFVLFSLSKTILVTYIFPLYPAAAVFVGSYWAAAASNDQVAGKGMRVGLWVAFIFSVLLGLAVFLVAPAKFPGSRGAAAVLGGLLIVGPAVALGALRGRGISKGIWAIGAGMTVFTFWLIYAVMPFIAPCVSTRDLLKQVPLSEGAKYATFGRIKPSVVYYLDRTPLFLNKAGKVNDLLARTDAVFVVCRKWDLGTLDMAGSVVIARSGDLLVVGNKRAASLKGAEPK